MNRAAKEGRYCGGIVPYGFRVDGHKQTARLVAAEEMLPGCLMSQAEIIRHIFRRLAYDGWACRRIAKELNDLGVPTKYAIEGRGVRGERTQGLWGAGRVRNMVVNPVYKGKGQYGRRSTKRRDVIAAEVEALVPEELWQAAQDALARNRSCAKNTPRVYLLRGVMRCGTCGRAYNGSQHHGDTWYRCNGTLNRTELVGTRCQGKILRGEPLETLVWSDIERFLRDPGEILRELEAEVETDPVREAMEQERARWQSARMEWQARRERLLELYEGGHRTKKEMEERLGPILDSLTQANNRLAALEEQEQELEPTPVSVDLLDQIHQQLNAGLTDEKRAEIVRLLVKGITVNTDIAENGKKTQRVFVEYRFPGVSATYSGRDSSPRPACNRPGRRRCRCVAR
jgi:site-specific DNA recombinase